MPKTESQLMRESMQLALAAGETMVAESRARINETGDRVLVIVTESRILWRGVAAIHNASAFPLQEISFASIIRAREWRSHGRAHIELTADVGRRVVFEFNRPDASAALAVRDRIDPLRRSPEASP